MIAGKEGVRRLEQRVQGGKQLTVGDFTPTVSPQHLNGVEPRAVGRQIQQPQPPCRGTDHGLSCVIGMRICVIPGAIAGAGRMAIDQGLQPFGARLAPRAAAEQHDGVARMIVDGAQPIALGRLPWGGNHDLLTARTPQGAQGGQPTAMAFVRRVTHFTRLQMVAAVFKRLFFPA